MWAGNSDTTIFKVGDYLAVFDKESPTSFPPSGDDMAIRVSITKPHPQK